MLVISWASFRQHTLSFHVSAVELPTAHLQFAPYVAYMMNLPTASTAKEKLGIVKYRILFLTENVHKKATPQHRSYSLLLETGQKAGKSVPSLSNIPQNYSEDNSLLLTQLLRFWFSARKFFPWCYFFYEVSLDQWPSFFLAGHQYRQHVLSVFWSMHRWWLSPFHCSFFFPLPDLILSLAKD